MKIISKFLANILSSILNDIIDDHQSSFIKGRNILDYMATTQEVTQFLARQKRSGFLLKLASKMHMILLNEIVSCRPFKA